MSTMIIEAIRYRQKSANIRMERRQTCESSDGKGDSITGIQKDSTSFLPAWRMVGGTAETSRSHRVMKLELTGLTNAYAVSL
ncbi:MAG: hypothetical protein SOW48_02700 [Peptoniphilaceae bacterium]|nr:hypothetical protein [Peptoniphilaceae bacterium]MDY3075536.1 hypothetical protein [Peptoniphilaceae bacterium]